MDGMMKALEIIGAVCLTFGLSGALVACGALFLISPRGREEKRGRLGRLVLR
jgi:hypothetical protein